MSFFTDLMEDVARHSRVARATRDCPLDILVTKREAAIEEVAALQAFIARADREIARRNAESDG